MPQETFLIDGDRWTVTGQPAVDAEGVKIDRPGVVIEIDGFGTWILSSDEARVMAVQMLHAIGTTAPSV